MTNVRKKTSDSAIGSEVGVLRVHDDFASSFVGAWFKNESSSGGAPLARAPSLASTFASPNLAEWMRVEVGGECVAELSTADFSRNVESFARRHSESERMVLFEAIANLLLVRDSLGLQLQHAKGMVTDEEFERRADAAGHFSLKTYNLADLAHRISVLLSGLQYVRFDAEALSDALLAEISDVEQGLDLLLGHRMAPTTPSSDHNQETD